MPTPARILRAEAQNLDRTKHYLSDREIARNARILALGQSLMARHGRHNLTLPNLAVALHIGADTLRRHYADLDALLGEILRRHLMALATALGDVPRDAPDRQSRRRAAYLAFTRTPLGGFSEAHLLLVRDRHLLPDDELAPIEQTRDGLGDLLAGPLACEALALLDATCFDAAQIEHILANLIPAALPAPLPEPRPTEPQAAAIRPRQKTPRPKIPDTWDPEETPGSWIYNCGIPLARAPPKAA